MSAISAFLPPDVTSISAVETNLKPGPCGVELSQMPPPDDHAVPVSPGADPGFAPKGTCQRFTSVSPKLVFATSRNDAIDVPLVGGGLVGGGLVGGGLVGHAAVVAVTCERAERLPAASNASTPNV